MIGPRTSIGERPHRVLLQNPVATVPDGEGGYTQTWADLQPNKLFAKIAPATAEAIERVAPGTTQALVSHIVSMPYHAGVTTKTRIIHDARTFHVTGVATPDERKQETIALCEEVVS